MPVTPKQIACTEKKKIAETSQKMKEKVKPEHVSLYRQTLLWVREKSLTGAGSSETTAFATDPRKHCREMKWVIGKLVEKVYYTSSFIESILQTTLCNPLSADAHWKYVSTKQFSEGSVGVLPIYSICITQLLHKCWPLPLCS